MIHLSCAGRVVADYVVRPELALALSPRPYLHPVRTLAGVRVTEAVPRDHPWHLGLSIAVQHVQGADGRTANLWRVPGNPATLRERRIVAASPICLPEQHDSPPRAWALRVGFTLENVTPGVVRLGRSLLVAVVDGILGTEEAPAVLATARG